MCASSTAGGDLLAAEVARHLDQIGAALELLPDGLPESVGSRCLDDRSVHPGVNGQPFGAVTAGRGDQLPGGEDPRAGDPVVLDPLFQDERHGSEGRGVAHRGDSGADEGVETFDAAQRGVRRVHRQRLRHIEFSVGEVGVEVHQPGKHRGPGHIQHPRGSAGQ